MNIFMQLIIFKSVIIFNLKEGIATVSGLSKAFAEELVYDGLGNNDVAAFLIIFLKAKNKV